MPNHEKESKRGGDISWNQVQGCMHNNHKWVAFFSFSTLRNGPFPSCWESHILKARLSAKLFI